MRCYSVGSVRRPRGSRRTPAQFTVTTTESQPVAPLGNTPASLLVWTAPVPSVARTWRVCSPDGASQTHTHCRQVSVPSAAPSLAVCHGPLSTLTCTREMPRCGAQATPPTATRPAETCASGRGTSIRDSVLIGACSAYPRWVQYACWRAKVVTSSLVTHLVADT